MRTFAKSALRASSCLTIAAAAIAVASPAYAQDAEEECTDEGGVCTPDVNSTDADGGDTEGAIVVTGSRLSKPGFQSTVPITSIGGDTFFQQGDPNVGESLNDLPALRSTFSQQNPGLGIGIAGLNLLDLRGLGTVRTLTLVNGRRHVAADILNNAVSPDVNTIPSDLIERVDIITGGNSAVYGSDAIAGVVNFVLKNNFEGAQLRGAVGVSDKGYGANHYISGMVGKNFADDRGNVTLHAEFSNQDRLFGSQVPWLRQVDSFATVDVDPAGLTNASDGFSDFVFLRDLRSASINRFGLIPITQRFDNPTTTAVDGAFCGVGVGQTIGGPGTTGSTAAGNGIPYNCTYLFDATGTLATQTGSRYGAGIIGGILGGNGQTGREDQLLSILPEIKRYNANLLAHFEVSEALELFTEAKFARTDVRGNNAGASFNQGTFGTGDFRERVRLDNPFLTAAQRTTIANAILASGCNTSLTATCVSTTNATGLAARSTAGGSGQGIGGPLNAADIAAINAGTYRFVVSRNLSDNGIRDEIFQRDTYRIVGGLRGTFNEDWRYELSANYGRFDQTVDTAGYIDRQRFSLAMDAGRNPVTGQIQCRSQFDPTAAVAYDSGIFRAGGASRANASQLARLASDIAACVPYNSFGAADNSASINYFTRSNHTDASLSQLVFNGFVAGDTSQFFELPGGPIGFVLGGEYREEKARYFDDDFVLDSPNTNSVTIGDFIPPKFKVKEAFAEIEIPILEGLPFADELTISGAGRVSDYGGGASATGTVWTYNVGADYAPIPDIRFRANYGKAVRAPNLSELYFPIVPNFAPGFADPCNSTNIGNNPNRLANCQAQLSATQLSGLPAGTYSLQVLSGSNPNLTAETSKSLTVGAVLQPRFVPGFQVSVDYYDIKVDDVIVSLSAQQIANQCYDQADLSNVFCGLFTRYTGPTPGPDSEISGQIRANTLIQAGVNFAQRRRRGIDVNASYRHRFNDNIALDTSVIYLHALQSSNFQNPASPDIEDRLLGELGDPKDEFRWDTDLSIGEFTFGYRMHYIGPMYTSSYENLNVFPSACTSPTVCPPFNLDIIEPRTTPAVFYHDIRLQWDLEETFQFYLGVDNLLDTHPPFGQTGTGGINADRGGGTSAIYDAFGRRVFAGFKARF